MIAYLLFCVLCVLLAFFMGGVLAFWMWLAGNVLIVCMAVIYLVSRFLYRAWDKATSIDD